MDFVEYTNTWAKSEVLQGKIMVGLGVLLILAFVAILRSEHELLKGSLIPFGLLLVVLIGYGSYILYSRPAHAKESIALYQKSAQEAITNEIAKHTNDNKAGKTLMRFVYPTLIIVSALMLFFIPGAYYKGMAIGFIILFASTYIMDYGFVSRSDAFIYFLKHSS